MMRRMLKTQLFVAAALIGAISSAHAQADAPSAASSAPVEQTAPPSAETTQPAPPDSGAEPQPTEQTQPAAEPTTEPVAEPAPTPTPVPTTAPAATIALDDTATSPPPAAAESASAQASEASEKPEKSVPWPFQQWRINLGVGLGWASSGDETWTILGVGAGLYVIDGLNVGLSGTFWVGGSPFVSTITPTLTYVFHFVPVVQPYLGTFYRHYFVGDGYLDTDSVGGRLGVYIPMGKHVYLGGGIVYEHFFDDDVFASRDDVYPEITIAFSF